MAQLQIDHLIIHDIYKKQRETLAVFKPSTKELAKDHLSEVLTTELHEAISTSKKKVYGIFQKIGISYFKSLLDNYLQNENDLNLLDLTKEMIGDEHNNSLIEHMKKEPLSTGGHIVVTTYFYLSKKYIVVAMLNNKEGKAITYDDNGVPHLVPTAQIDFELMDIACRIDISEYLDEESKDNYLSFFSSRDGFSKYFIDFIGCQHFNQPKDNTRKLVQLIDKASETEDEPESFRSKAYDFCTQKQSNGDLIVIEDLSIYLYGEEKKDKLNEIKSLNKISLDNSFIANKTELNKLISFKYKGDWIDSLKFNRKNIDNIIVNEEEQSVILNKVPKLITKILRESR